MVLQHNIEDETLTYVSKVDSWLESNSVVRTLTPSSSSATNTSVTKLFKVCVDAHANVFSIRSDDIFVFKGLLEILQDTNKGKSILDFYKNNNNGAYLSPKDHPPILSEIKLVFPNETHFLVSFFYLYLLILIQSVCRTVTFFQGINEKNQAGDYATNL